MKSKFPLGQIVTTPAAINAISSAAINKGLCRHSQGDWGDVCAEDKESNDEALINGTRLMSVYKDGGKPFWIITEADRSVTTVLLPEDY